MRVGSIIVKFVAIGIWASSAILLQACAGESGPANTSETPDGSAPPAASRAITYTSLRQLAADAQIVVAGRLVGDIRENPYYGDATTPFVIADFQASQFFKGKATSNNMVQLSLEGAMSDKGAPTSSKLDGDATYVLFLTEQGPRSPGVYTVVGYLAGIFEKTGDGSFRRIDSESPDLPATVRTKDIEEAVAAQSN